MGILILTGPKHVGKTSVGMAVAGLLGLPFTDLDRLVEEHTGKSPRALYSEGVEVFRAAETEALRSLIDEALGERCSMIVAAGGGIVDNPAAAALLKHSEGIRLAYIQVSAETAWERIKAAAEQTGELPPFLNTEHPQETHRTLHSRRAAAYRELALFTVEGEDGNPGDIARKIVQAMNPGF